jgi:hypothetical protein
MAILNAFGIGEELQQPRVFSLPSLLVRTLLFPLICGLFLMSLMVQDLAFPQQFAGRFGANLALFLLPAMLLWTRDTLKAITVVRLHFFFRTGLILMSFMLMFSMAYLLELPRVVLGEVLLLKTFKTLLTLLVWWLSVAAGVLMWQRFRGGIALLSRVMFVFLLAFLVLEVMAPQANRMAGPWHLDFAGNYRPRLLSPESSYAGGVIAVFGFLVLLTSRRLLEKLSVMVCIALGLWLVGSKGGALVFAAAVALAHLWHAWRDLMAKRLRSFLVMVTLLTVFAVLVRPLVESAIAGLRGDLALTSSVATRSTLLVSGVVVLLQQPLGGGFGSYLAFAPDWIRQSLGLIGGFFGPQNLFEVQGYLLSTNDTTFAPKDLPTTLIWFGGWFGLLLYLFLIVVLLSRVRRQPVMAKAGALFFVLATTAYLPSTYEYNQMFLVGVLLANPAIQPLRFSS